MRDNDVAGLEIANHRQSFCSTSHSAVRRQGFRDDAWKAELAEIERRRAELEATVAALEAEPALSALHPNMATAYRQKVEQLAAALTHDDEAQREAARTALRGFIDAISFIDSIIVPAGDGLLRVVGDLGQMLRAAADARDGAVLAAVVECGCGGLATSIICGFGDLEPEFKELRFLSVLNRPL